MADFGDEMGDAIWRSLKTPFDEWFRCQIRRLVSGDSNLEPNFNKDGMDPDGRTRQVEGLWKDWMKDEVNNLPDNLNIGQFCDQIAERGIGVDVAKGGGYQLYDPLNPHHRINLKNLDAKYSDEKLGLRSKETVSEEKTRESRDRTDRLSRERDLGEIGDKEIPSQQLITR